MSPERILVVDDDEGLLAMMSAYLRRGGYEVEEASNGEAALEHLQTLGPFDVLVTDMLMPRMNGVELLREARKLDPHLEIVVVTAVGSLDSAVEVMKENGAYNFLLKPFERMSDLATTVGRAADHRRLLLERESLQGKLASETLRLQTLIANIGDAVLSADAEGLIQVANPAAVRLLKQEALIGQPAQTSLPAPLATLLANWESAGAHRVVVVDVPWPAEAVQMVNLAPLATNPGVRHGWVMVIRDISHLKRQDEIKMRILKDTADKIQFPLARAILTLAELKEVAEEHDPHSAEVYYRLVKLWGRIQEWVDKLLALMRIESGIGIQLRAVDLLQIVNEVQQDLKTALNDKGVALEMKMPVNLAMVRADPNLLRQALEALLHRAVLCSKRNDTIRLSAYEQRDYVWIDIVDMGLPITESDWPHALEKSGETSGGWELTMAKTIIDKVEGQLWMSGQETLGNTISLCLLALAHTNNDVVDSMRLVHV